MTSRETLALLWFLAAAAAFVLSVAYMARFRNRKYSVAQLLLSGPMLFVAPERYFVEGKHSAPWRALALWLVSIGLLVMLAAITDLSR